MANKLAVIDLETDPFEYGSLVQPFLGGFYDGSRTITYWSDDCVARLVETLGRETESYTIYAHNGGRFDFFYFMRYLGGDLRIINGRIVQASMGKHELRDSYAIMPFPLADYDKGSIDYAVMHRDKREQHRDEILRYFQRDLTSLYELVTAFHAEFGDKLTIGSASMAQIQSRHKFSRGSAEYDAEWRERFYFGGRNQVFKPGITRGVIRVPDVNSMYPYVMQAYLHPIGTSNYVSKYIEKDTVFVVATGRNFGAFPTRQKDGSLDFTVESGTFHTTIHEWNAALETGCFKPTKIIKTYNWPERGTFEDFVSHFYDARAIAKKNKDSIHSLFYKYVLNSGYGKFAQNPENYFDYSIQPMGTYPEPWHECSKSCASECKLKWMMEWIHERYVIWKLPTQAASETRRNSWYNIATGASITGAARAVLLRGLSVTRNPLYCDTDSIICAGDSSVTVHPTNLGSWDIEATGTMVAIGGKKLYALFAPVSEVAPETLEKIGKENLYTDKGLSVACVKKAHKGARLNGPEIMRIVNGGVIESRNPVPNFKWDGTYQFTKRRIRRTA